MKKFLFRILFAVLAISSVAMVGCSKDDEEGTTDSSIVGKWQLTSVSPKEMEADYDKSQFTDILEFKADGTYATYDKNGNSLGNLFGGKWSINGKTLRISSNVGIDEDITIETLNETTLVLSQDTFYLDDDYNMVDCTLRETYKRVQ